MSKLYLVPTPIGNLKDITFRALEVLQEVDEVLAEDTRQTLKLFAHYSISKPLKSYHINNEHKVVQTIVDRISGGTKIALVSDAGTPAISDPGFLLVRACVEQGVEVECLPGATAFVPALVNSGIPCNSFVFEGFLPHKKGKQTKIQQLAQEQRTVVLYESPHRINKTLEQLIPFFGAERKASLSREISKLHEETVRGTLQELLQHFTATPAKGEIVLVIEGAQN